MVFGGFWRAVSCREGLVDLGMLGLLVYALLSMFRGLVSIQRVCDTAFIQHPYDESMRKYKYENRLTQ